MLSSRIARTVAASLVVGIGACERPTEPDGFPGDVSSWVVGEAAQRLDSSGRFVLPDPTAPGPAPITSPVAASNLAHVFLRQFTSPSAGTIGDVSIAEDLERQRGAQIAFPSLVPAARAYYAASPYLPLPDTLPPWLRKYLGPFFLVPLLERNDPAVVVASSAYNTDFSIEAGQLVFPSVYGNDFWWAGIPLGAGYVLPITPEHAVEVVWRATRTRVNQVPLLIGPGRLYFPHYARWRVSLEHPILVQGTGSGQVYTTSDLYVSGQVVYSEGRGIAVQERIQVALAAQPDRDTVQYRCTRNPDEVCNLVVQHRAEVPVLFESVHVVR